MVHMKGSMSFHLLPESISWKMEAKTWKKSEEGSWWIIHKKNMHTEAIFYESFIAPWLTYSRTEIDIVLYIVFCVCQWLVTLHIVLKSFRKLNSQTWHDSYKKEAKPMSIFFYGLHLHSLLWARIKFLPSQKNQGKGLDFLDDCQSAENCQKVNFFFYWFYILCVFS